MAEDAGGEEGGPPQPTETIWMYGINDHLDDPEIEIHLVEPILQHL